MSEDHTPGTDSDLVPDASPRTPTAGASGGDRLPRPMVERLGMAAIAIALAGMFGLVAVAAFSGGEPFLGVMGVCGCLMVLWVGGITLFRG